MENENNKIDIFEVFKLNQKNRDELSNLDEDTLRKTYSILRPLEKKEQLKEVVALTILPPSTHMVVDSKSFQNMIQKKAKDIDIDLSKKYQKKVDDLNLEASKLFESERIKIRNELKDLILNQIEILKIEITNEQNEKIEHKEEKQKGEIDESTTTKNKKQIEIAFEKCCNQIDKIFNAPIIIEKKKEEDEHNEEEKKEEKKEE